MNMFKPTKAKTPEEYISMIDEPRRSEVKKVYQFIRETLPGEKPYILIGMIAFIPFHYKSKSGREGEWAVVALASQKNYISVYVCAADGKQYVAEKYKSKLPKANIGRSCIRFNKLDDLDHSILKKIITEGKELARAGKTAM
jgi:hypothetical protein